ncbi:ankyrin [Clavulina sp. PMI_390]|nr:ankyrin [Clavulina sp. PMI_390]
MSLALPGGDDHDGALKDLWKEAVCEFKKTSQKPLNDPTLSEIFGHDLTSESIENALVKCGLDLKKFRKRGSFILNILKPFLDTFKAVIDPIGDVVANAGVPAGAVIFAAVGRLLEAIQGVSKHYDDLAEALIQIHGMLSRVKLLFDADAIGPALRKLCVEALSQVLVIISHFVKYCEAAHSKRVSKVMGARFGDFFGSLTGGGKARAAFAELRRLISESDQFINAQTLAVTTQIHNLQRLQLIFDKIAPTNSRQNQDERLEQGKVVPDHAKWLFASKSFKDWLETPHGFFWVSAHGKSVLCAEVIKHLQESARASGAAIAYHYFDYRMPDKRLYDKLLASIITHFSNTSSECKKVLLSTFADALIPTTTSRSELLALVKSMLATCDRKFLVVDALDECLEEGNNRKLLLSYLHDLAKKLVPRNGTLHIFATSRPLHDIERALWHAHNKVVTHRLHLGEENDHKTTLRTFINTNLHGEDFEDSDWSPSFKEGVASTLIDKSQSMFLWAQLQIKRLKGYTQTEASQMLLDLPTGIAATYTRILREVDGRRRDTVRAVLECIIAASSQGRPLTPVEIQEILRFNLQPTQQRPKVLLIGLNHQDDAPHTGPHGSKAGVDIFKYLPSALLKLDENGNVQFIHFTVQEYLFSQPEHDETLHHHFGTSLRNATSTLLLVLLSALDRMNIRSVPTLMHYADIAWYIHAKSALAEDEAILNTLEHFLDPESQSFADWVERRYEPFDLSYYRESNERPLHCDHPIHWAIRIGSLAQVKRLYQLNLGNKVNARLDIHNVYDTLNWTPLCWAAVCGDIRIFTFLLEGNKSWVHQHVGLVRNENGRQRDTSTVLNILLCTEETPFHIPNVEGLDKTRLAWPLHSLHSLSCLHSQSATMVHVLLDSITNQTAIELLSACGETRYPPLLNALHRRRNREQQDWFLALIRALLSKGASPHIQTKQGKGIVHIACQWNSWILPVLMAEIKIDLNLGDKNADTPLHAAVRRFDMTSIEMLLNVGADPNRCNNNGDGPLDVVVKEIAKYQNPADSWQRSMLMEYKAMGPLLEQHGARLHSQAHNES